MNRIVLIPIGGLCNRLRFVCSAYNEFDHREIEVWWIPGDECNIGIKELLDMPSELKVLDFYGNELGAYFAKKWIGLQKRIFGRTNNQLEFAKMVMCLQQEQKRAQYMELINDGKRHYCIGCEKIGEDYFFDDFKIREVYEGLVYNISKEYMPYVSMHIRRGDFSDVTEKQSPLYLFEEIVKKQAECGKNVFIATDDFSIKEYFAERYENVFTRDNVDVSRDSVEGMRDAFIDLIMLSNGEIIYGTRCSSFSEVAARIGRKDLVEVSI